MMLTYGIDSGAGSLLASAGKTASVVDPANPQIADGPKEIGTQQDFLLLLIEQIKAQDPFNPMDSTEFTNQLVAFTQLEQVITLNGNIADMKQNQDMAAASQLVGKYVEGLDANGAIVTGVVDSAERIDGEATVLVGDQILMLGQVYTVRDSEKGP
jgi:flagellar basal-body rod modification protein FlgD